MPITTDFNDTVKARADRDPAFRQTLLVEAMEALVGGEFDVAKVLLRNYIKATDGFETVGDAVGKSPKSVMRMLGDQGNPNVKNLFAITKHLQESAGISFKVVAESK